MEEHLITNQQKSAFLDTDTFMYGITSKAIISLETTMEAKFHKILDPIQTFQRKLHDEVVSLKEGIETINSRMTTSETNIQQINDAHSDFEKSLAELKEELKQTNSGLSGTNENIQKIHDCIQTMTNAASTVAAKVEEIAIDTTNMKKKWEAHAETMKIYEDRVESCSHNIGAIQQKTTDMQEESSKVGLAIVQSIQQIRKEIKVHGQSIESIASNGISSGLFGVTVNPLGFQEASLRMKNYHAAEITSSQNEREESTKKRKL
jgi:chromosome segregation ATPase